MLKILYYIRDFIGRYIYFLKRNKSFRSSNLIIFSIFIILNFICILVNYLGIWDFLFIILLLIWVISLILLFILYKSHKKEIIIMYITIKNNEWIRSLILIISGLSFFLLMMFYWWKIYGPWRLWIDIFYIFFRIVCIFKLIPSDYIEPEIKNLQDSLWKYSVAIQYTPPKWLNPSELWLLYSLKSNSTNIDCLLYKWEYERLIKIEDRWSWSILIHKIWEIGNSVPTYEKQFWSSIFKTGFKDTVVWNRNQLNLDKWIVSKIHLELLDYCVKKWLMYKDRDHLFWISIFWVFIFPLFFIYIIYCMSTQWKYLWTNIWRTKKWKELYAQIMWYKYWLEKCEEEQVKTILEEDPWFKSRNLPYIIALRMDWKFLYGKFN